MGNIIICDIHTVMTCPNTALSIFSGSMPAAWIAADDATIDNSVALLLESMPPIEPYGVRFAATMKIPGKAISEFSIHI